MRIPRYIRIRCMDYATEDRVVGIWVRDMAKRWWVTVIPVPFQSGIEFEFTLCVKKDLLTDIPIRNLLVRNFPRPITRKIIKWLRSIRWAFISPLGVHHRNHWRHVKTLKRIRFYHER